MEGAVDWNSRIGKRIKLRDLHILQAAVDAGSMMKAASDLAITQPAVSYAIGEIEHALGVPLLDRTSQGVTPTVYGRALLQRSGIVFNELRLGINEINSLADPAMGEVRIGTTPPMSAIASAVFNRLVPAYPHMTFVLNVEGTHQLLRQLRQREVELVITRLADWVREDDLHIEILFHDEVAVICGKQNKWARRRDVSLADLISEPWLLPPPDGFLTQLLRREFEEQGLEMPQPTVTATSTYNALAVLTRESPFLAIHPGTMLTMPRTHSEVTAVDVRLPTTRGQIGLITLKSGSLSPAAKLFQKSVASVVKEMRTSRSRRTARK
jgi:DNA-binding transcriptional LysR family regulator